MDTEKAACRQKQRWEWCGQKPRKPWIASEHAALAKARMDSPLEPLERGWLQQCFDFGLQVSRIMREYISVVVSHPFCGKFITAATESRYSRWKELTAFASFSQNEELHPDKSLKSVNLSLAHFHLPRCGEMRFLFNTLQAHVFYQHLFKYFRYQLRLSVPSKITLPCPTF